ncbi:sensor histidine kinase [Sinomicrobium pectinilyticum]|uniref:histidine kinase n=1 Tax=Sinomicrobium pectinilyticum TaxID=1084421 RepID=A0A3N0EIU9_SINP1|nr:histidine kinase dimerization/phospho-acceptor domain-containing protein [Sinomicrobium pectinilyticum]RNL87825.1 sensor histidine kinase [Sinomicrobium pectinilyticum]
MQKRSLKNYTLRYLVIAILGIIALWAALFYMYIIEEVYDNIDDGLKDSRLRIMREAEGNPEILRTREYDIARFKITPLPPGDYSRKSHIYNSKMYMPYDDDDEPVRVLQTIFSSGGQEYQLEIYTSTVEEDELLEDLLTALVVLYIALVVSIILINHFILRKAWMPFYRLMEQLRNYKIGGRTSLEPVAANVREFDELYGEISAMVARNEAVYTQQKQFIENASHELQTPLAIAINKLELLMGRDGLSEQNLVQIDEVNRTLQRLKRLNRSLLMLSRIENRQFRPSESIILNELVHQSLTDLEVLSKYKKTVITIDEKGDFIAEMNRDLATVLINNLLKNAIVHNAAGGILDIHISEREIVISNSGKTSLNPEQIFERFYKDEQSENSTGLGLAIVKSIIRLYPALSIDYRFEERHCFVLRKQ